MHKSGERCPQHRNEQMAKTVEVGKEYVLACANMGIGFVPVQCNSRYSPLNPCRVTITSVGRKYAKALISGYSKPTQVGSGIQVNTGGLWEIDEAKKLYRASLEARDAKLTSEGHKGIGQAYIDELVEGL